jgi:hypothetical protein
MSWSGRVYHFAPGRDETFSTAGLLKTDNSRKHKKEKLPKMERRVSLLPAGEPEEDEIFSVHRVPSKRRLFEAGTCFVRDENGELVCFGDFFPRWPEAPSAPR